MAPQQRSWFERNRGTVIGSAVTLLISIGAVWLVRSWLSTPVQQTQKVVQEIALVRPPPPPPEEEPPPPPPEIEEEVDLPEPEPAPDPMQSDEPPPMDNLGLDADGVAGSDAFGLMANRGGRSITGAGGGDRYRWYAGVLRQAISAHLAQFDKIRSRAYNVTIRVWQNRAGEVQRVTLNESTGDPELDIAIEQALQSLKDIGGRPPAGMQQPVTIRVITRL